MAFPSRSIGARRHPRLAVLRSQFSLVTASLLSQGYLQEINVEQTKARYDLNRADVAMGVGPSPLSVTVLTNDLGGGICATVRRSGGCVPGEGACRWRHFSARFVRGAFSEGVYESVLSTPRGDGKSSLAGELLASALHPEGPLFVAGGESVLLASSLEQARLPFGFLRTFIGEDSRFRWLDSGQRVKATLQAYQHVGSCCFERCAAGVRARCEFAVDYRG